MSNVQLDVDLLDADIFASEFKEGFASLPAAKRFTAEQLEVIYGMAYAHAQQKQWQKALGIFAFLSQYGPTRRHYLAGLALCLQKLQRYDEAINIYSLMLVLFGDNLEPSLYIAECELAQGDTVAALATLRQLDKALDDGDALKKRAQVLASHVAQSRSVDVAAH